MNTKHHDDYLWGVFQRGQDMRLNAKDKRRLKELMDEHAKRQEEALF